MNTMKTLLIGLAGLALATAPIAASAHPVNQGGWNHAQGFQGRGDGYHGDNGRSGAAVAAGIFGFLLAATIVSAHDQAYAQPTDYGQTCGWQTQAYNVGYGRVAYRQVEVCN
jgi:hypothetical protein